MVVFICFEKLCWISALLSFSHTLATSLCAWHCAWEHEGEKNATLFIPWGRGQSVQPHSVLRGWRPLQSAGGGSGCEHQPESQEQFALRCSQSTEGHVAKEGTARHQCTEAQESSGVTAFSTQGWFHKLSLICPSPLPQVTRWQGCLWRTGTRWMSMEFARLTETAKMLTEFAKS